MNILSFFILIAYIAGNCYIYIQGLQCFHSFPVWVKWVYSILFWFCFSSAILIHFLRNTQIPLPVLNFLYEIGTGWLVFILYFALFLILFNLLRVFNIHYEYSFITSFILTLCVLTYGYIHFQHPVTRVINIPINKAMPETSSLKVVGISDLHLGYRTTKGRLRNYVKMINDQQPDMILISGDLIDSSIEPVRRQGLGEELSLLKAPLGIYMVPGNHEYISGIADCIDFINKNTPIHLLRDTVISLPNGLQIIGRDDRHNKSREQLSSLIHQADTTRPVFVLDHQPFELSQAVDTNADFLFCGHTHRGQVWPISWLTDYIFEVSHGQKTIQNTNIYVSSGLALWGAPFRIGTDSEMVVFNFTFKNP